MKRIGIVAHSAEGGALCFITACREGQRRLGAHMHPEIVLSAVPMQRSMAAWEANDFDEVAIHLGKGIDQVAAAGADFFICPDNTAHIVLEQMSLPIPMLHIADVVCDEMKARGLSRAGLLGTKWTMDGPVYQKALERYGFTRIIPNGEQKREINRAIFEELCLGQFLPETTQRFVAVISDLQRAGADCAILGCTEIPLIINDDNSPLPVLDSTRLLARAAVAAAIQ